MSNVNTETKVAQNINLRTLAEILVRHLGLHTGRYQVAINFQIGVGQFPSGLPEPTSMLGALMGVSGIRLDAVPDHIDGNDIVDAAIVNPAKSANTPRKRAAQKA